MKARVRAILSDMVRSGAPLLQDQRTLLQVHIGWVLLADDQKAHANELPFLR
jgi:hypothetical protein